MFERIKKWHSMGLWTEEMVKNAVDKGVITEEQCNEILGVIEEETTEEIKEEIQ